MSNGMIYRVVITLDADEGFSVEPINGIMTPGVADILLALKVSEDMLMAQYYEQVNEEAENLSGFDSEVRKAE